jgi:hypothetical protein
MLGGKNYSKLNDLAVGAYKQNHILKELGNILHMHILQSPAPVANNPDNAELPAQSMAVTLFS